jgi:DNA-binding transcriptional LysR family regulator
LSVDISYTSTNEQVVALAHGDLDIGLLTPPFDAPPRMKVIPLENEPLVAALPTAMAGAGESVSLSTLHAHLMLFPRPDGPVLYDAIVDLFRTAGLPLTKAGDAREYAGDAGADSGRGRRLADPGRGGAERFNAGAGVSAGRVSGRGADLAGSPDAYAVVRRLPGRAPLEIMV